MENNIEIIIYEYYIVYGLWARGNMMYRSNSINSYSLPTSIIKQRPFIKNKILNVLIEVFF